MKKGLKISLISLASLIGLLLIAVGIALLTIFTPARLTKLVNKEAPRFITCEFHLDKADLTFFKTFPFIGIDLHNLILINPTEGAPNDTLLQVKDCVAALNIRELLKNNHITIKKFELDDGYANIFINESGQNNYSVFKSDTTSTSEFDYSLDLQKVKTKNVNITYYDRQFLMKADLQGLNLQVKGKMKDDDVRGKVCLNTKNFAFNTLDSTALSISYDKLNFNFDGDLTDLDKLRGDLSLNLGKLSLLNTTDKFVNSKDIHLASNINLDITDQKATLQKTSISLADYELSLDGNIRRIPLNGNIDFDLRYKTQQWPLAKVLALIPESVIGDALKDIAVDGDIGLTGKVIGTYSTSSTPLITADVELHNGTFSMKDFPLSFQKINTLCNLKLDLDGQSDITVKSLDCYTGKNHLSAEGTIKDLLGKMLFHIALNGNLHVPDFKAFFPETFSKVDADAIAKVEATFDLEQLQNLAFDQMTAHGNFLFSNLDFVYNDSISVQSPSLSVDILFPIEEYHPYDINEWAKVELSAAELTGNKIGLGTAEAENAKLTAYVNDLLDSTQKTKFGVIYDFTYLSVQTDSVEAWLSQPNGTVVMKDGKDLSLKHFSRALGATVENELTATTQSVSIFATSHYNDKESNLLMKWNPDAQLMISDASAHFNGIDVPLKLPALAVNLNTKECDIDKAEVIFGRSNFQLKGKIIDIDKYFQGTDLLRGNLELQSQYIDINEIMDVVSGLNAPDSLLEEKAESSDKEPFMVPYGMDIRVHTLIQKALFEEAEIRNVGGYLSIKDGVLVLDEMGLTSDAARMQLTALYKSPRKNHLFLGLDFHLLDIKIDQLINMIPEVDTVLPMLKSFAGNAEFHFAVETYLKSNYELKFSTLRGAAAINGNNLVVLDNETYQNIAKKLMFSKKTQNRIDSLSAEITIFKNEIDVYPFAVSIDKYQAILSGRHNLDMTYNYNISLLKPIQLGLDIIGTDKLKFKVGKAKYPTLFRPERQNVVEQNIMQLKQQINAALKSNVREQPIEPQQ